jgi:hypothetical protein
VFDIGIHRTLPRRSRTRSGSCSSAIKLSARPRSFRVSTRTASSEAHRLWLTISSRSLCLAQPPLASNFALTQGQVSFVVPNVVPNYNYIVVRAYILFLVYLRRDAHFALWPRGQSNVTRVLRASNSLSKPPRRKRIEHAFTPALSY